VKELSQDPEAIRLRAYRASSKYDKSKRNARNRANPTPFAGVDGEGITITEGQAQRYVLLRAGKSLLYNINGLSFSSCMEFIATLPQSSIYVAFAFDYDVSMIMSALMAEVADDPKKLSAVTEQIGRLFVPQIDPKTNQPYPTVGFFGDYMVRYMPHKHFSVSKRQPKGKWKGVTIHDVFGFFQSSFLVSLKKWSIGDPSQLAMIEAEKEKRSDFSLSTWTENEVEYNRIECEYLQELMSKVRSTATELGYSISPYEGAGCLAQSILKTHGALRTAEVNELVPPEALSAAQAAFYGGRFEITRHGVIAGPIYEYDINSAYPSAMVNYLPCLRCGEWHHSIGYDKGDVAAGFTPLFVYVSWELRNITAAHELPYWGPLPFRTKKSSILYPTDGMGWYAYIEVEPWLNKPNSSPYKFTVHDVWSYHTTCEHRPFEWAQELYDKRIALGAKSAGIVLKLGLNSLYGKCAQSVGKPTFANPVYASLITAYTRAMIGRCLKEYQSSVFMVATDAVYSTVALDVDTSGEKLLGHWEQSVYDEALVVQPGVYFLNGDIQAIKTRSRGVPVRKLSGEYSQLRAKADTQEPIIMHLTSFQGLRSCWRRHHLGDQLGSWKGQDRMLKWDYIKRSADGRLPAMHPGVLQSVPYQQVIGRNTPAIQDTKPSIIEDFSTELTRAIHAMTSGIAPHSGRREREEYKENVPLWLRDRAGLTGDIVAANLSVDRPDLGIMSEGDLYEQLSDAARWRGSQEEVGVLTALDLAGEEVESDVMFF